MGEIVVFLLLGNNVQDMWHVGFCMVNCTPNKRLYVRQQALRLRLRTRVLVRNWDTVERIEGSMVSEISDCPHSWNVCLGEGKYLDTSNTYGHEEFMTNGEHVLREAITTNGENEHMWARECLGMNGTVSCSKSRE